MYFKIEPPVRRNIDPVLMARFRRERHYPAQHTGKIWMGIVNIKLSDGVLPISVKCHLYGGSCRIQRLRNSST